MVIALAGNQNCGKTTLFNALTGSNQHVGNFPGVTVSQKSGEIKGTGDCHLVDLPGIYSLRPYTAEEIVTRDFLLYEKPDGIINIIDATNAERNLYLTLQLLELKIPTVIALNMMDEMQNNGGRGDVSKMSKALGVPVVPISAAKKEGIISLKEQMLDVIKKKKVPDNILSKNNGAVKHCLEYIGNAIEHGSFFKEYPPAFCASRIFEDDRSFLDSFPIPLNEQKKFDERIRRTETDTNLDRHAALASMRYDIISEICQDCIIKSKESKEHIRSVKTDRLLTGKYTAFPIFLLILFTVFYMTFHVIGRFLSDILSAFLLQVTSFTSEKLILLNVNPVLRSLVIDGIFTGVGSVLGFLPIIVVLFFFLSVLEDTGYMARIAFIMDKPLRKIGLSGRSVVPMLLGFGCSVPAVMSARTLSAERDRKITVLLIPFMSCSAKIPIYAVFSAAFFRGSEALVMTTLYLSGIILGIFTAKVMQKTVFRGEPAPFVMELPNYRFPSPKSILLLLWEKAKDFTQKAFTVIFIASILIWFLQTFDTNLHIAANSTDSMLSCIGRWFAPLYIPLGFGDWRIVTSLISGFTAKEAVISTMSVLFGVSTAELPSVLISLFSPASAASFLLFALLYTPCAAAVSTLKNELGSGCKAAFTVIFQCAFAWITSFLFYNIIRFVNTII